MVGGAVALLGRGEGLVEGARRRAARTVGRRVGRVVRVARCRRRVLLLLPPLLLLLLLLLARLTGCLLGEGRRLEASCGHVLLGVRVARPLAVGAGRRALVARALVRVRARVGVRRL